MKRMLVICITAISMMLAACGASADSQNMPDSSTASAAESGSAAASGITEDLSDTSADDTASVEDDATDNPGSAKDDATDNPGSAKDDATDNAGSAEDDGLTVPDEGLRVVLTEIRDTVHPGESGASLKSAQAAADLLDFTHGTDLDNDTLASMTAYWYNALPSTSAESFSEQAACISDVLDTLSSDAGESLLSDAGVSDSSYPWTEEAYARAAVILEACAI